MFIISQHLIYRLWNRKKSIMTIRLIFLLYAHMFYSFLNNIVRPIEEMILRYTLVREKVCECVCQKRKWNWREEDQRVDSDTSKIDRYVYVGKNGVKVNAICTDRSVYINIILKNINFNICRSYLYMTEKKTCFVGLLSVIYDL